MYLYRSTHLSLSTRQSTRLSARLAKSHTSVIPSLISQRTYAHQSYGGGEGDPKGETPQDQGPNPSEHLEHPGPRSPADGGKSGAGEGGNASQESSGKGSGRGNAAQPKIHSESDPGEPSEDVKSHNEDMKKRHDRPHETDEGDAVKAGFWSEIAIMKFSFSSVLVLALAAEGTLASTWFSKAAYNKWHETELERWLSDHNVPYPTPADRKDLENLVKSNWESKVSKPYTEWDTPQLQKYLSAKGTEVKKGSESNKKSLVEQVKSSWTETSDSASDAYGNVKTWIFDSWTDSQLKAFADKNSIPVPQPRKRDTLIASLRENYESVAKKLGETAAYPGNWLYETWSESDLKEFLDERGVPVPQPTTRDKLIASVRRHARLSSVSMKESAAAASSSAASAQQSLSDAVFDAWSDSQIKEWADKNGIKVPQGSKRNELLALARKHRSNLMDGNVASSASSAFGAATTKAGNQYAQATDDAQLKSDDAFQSVVGTWSDSRLKAFLDARGVPVPQGGKKDDLVAAVRLNKHKAASGYSAWTFDTWTTENLKKWLSSQNNKAASKSGATRNDLLKQAQDSYSKASKSGGSSYASVTSYLAASTDTVKANTFDNWSESELKSYLDSYGIKTYQGSNINELRAVARRNAHYFRYGTSSVPQSVYDRVMGAGQWVMDQLKIGSQSGADKAKYDGQKAGDTVKEGWTKATHRAEEAAQQAGDKLKEEL
ncbi:hypothetical protein MMC09_005942 [Bachmanniomyces sp. S44760]|nr:hypothetical protein [Bachmanniomyces sp. S44760]